MTIPDLKPFLSFAFAEDGMPVAVGLPHSTASRTVLQIAFAEDGMPIAAGPMDEILNTTAETKTEPNTLGTPQR